MNNSIDTFFNMEDYYKDDDYNILVKDNINLNLKLGGYMYSHQNHSHDLISDESLSSRSSITDYIAAAASAAAQAPYVAAGSAPQPLPTDLSYQSYTVSYPMMPPVGGMAYEVPAMDNTNFGVSSEQMLYYPLVENNYMVPAPEQAPAPVEHPQYDTTAPALAESPCSHEHHQTLPQLLVSKFKDGLFEPDSHQCQHCNKTFTALNDLIAHYEKYNLFKMLKYKCPIKRCPFNLVGFNKKIYLRKHILTKHYDKKNFRIKTSSANEMNLINELIYSCSQCSKNFYRRDSLQRHYKLIHKRGEPPSGL